MVNFENHKVEGSYVVENKLVNTIQFAEEYPAVEKKSSNFFKSKARSAYRRIVPEATPPTILPNLVNDSLLSVISGMASKEKYDAILITYSYWADIVKTLVEQGFAGRKIIDPTDFLTLHQLYGNPWLGSEQIGTIFGSEIERMKQFDDIIHISYDELLLFSNFIPNVQHYYIPQFFEKKIRNKTAPATYDILFIGSNNPYNVEGINWFFKTVYPLLDKSLRIAVAGKICDHVTIDESNVIKLGFVEDAASLFSVSRCSICPLKKGSGIKIKVVESLSFGLPVISTLKGLDGFPNKMPGGGILVADDPGLFATHIKNLLGNAEFYGRQRAYASEIFDEQFSVDSNFSKLDKIFAVEKGESLLTSDLVDS
jgi:glycosyltransferase involved in cell wall biosynthesis